MNTKYAVLVNLGFHLEITDSQNIAYRKNRAPHPQSGHQSSRQDPGPRISALKQYPGTWTLRQDPGPQHRIPNPGNSSSTPHLEH